MRFLMIETSEECPCDCLWIAISPLHLDVEVFDSNQLANRLEYKKKSVT